MERRGGWGNKAPSTEKDPQMSHKGTCFCGSVEIEVTGDPVDMGYCHCESCRSWSAGPVNAFTLWTSENVTVTRGKEFVGVFKKIDNSQRTYCTNCGGHL